AARLSESLSLSISTDGRYVAFESDASNLVPGDTNDMTDVFVVDRSTSVITRASLGVGGVQGNGMSGARSRNGWDFYGGFVSLSGDGNSVAFLSLASNLGAGDTDSLSDIYVRKVSSATTTLA